MAVNKSLLLLALSIVLLLVLMMIPRVTLSDKNVYLSPPIDTAEIDKELSYKLLEEDFYLYLQDNLPDSHSLKYMLSSPTNKGSAILLSDIVNAEPPAWCNQHFVDE